METVLHGGVRPASFILSEANFNRSRDNLTTKNGFTIPPGTVCAKLTSGGKVVPFSTGETLSAGALTAGASGTDGTFPLVFTGGVGSGAAGTFTVVGGELVDVTLTDGGEYWTAPTLDFSGSANLAGAACTLSLSGTLTNGAGSDTPACINIYEADASGGDHLDAYVSGDAEVIGDALLWPANLPTLDKAAAIAALDAIGIKVRPSAY